MPEPARDTIRLDKWLWQARFFKSRALAAEVAASGRVRLNGRHVTKPAQPVGAGDVLIFPQGARMRICRVIATGARRGPASEAAGLYDDLEPAPALSGSNAAGPPASLE